MHNSFYFFLELCVQQCHSKHTKSRWRWKMSITIYYSCISLIIFCSLSVRRYSGKMCPLIFVCSLRHDCSGDLVSCLNILCFSGCVSTQIVLLYSKIAFSQRSSIGSVLFDLHFFSRPFLPLLSFWSGHRSRQFCNPDVSQ